MEELRLALEGRDGQGDPEDCQADQSGKPDGHCTNCTSTQLSSLKVLKHHISSLDMSKKGRSGPFAPEHRTCKDHVKSGTGMLAAVVVKAKRLRAQAKGLEHRISPAYSERGPRTSANMVSSPLPHCQHPCFPAQGN